MGTIAPGHEAEPVVCDAHRLGRDDRALGALAAGDPPGISMGPIDGVPRVGRSRDTAPARAVEVARGRGPEGPPAGSGGRAG